MLNKIIHFSIHNKFVIGLFTLGLIVWGIFSATHLPIDALPDITNNQVQIITQSPNLATQEIEKFITYPIERSLKSIPDITEMRSISRFGLSLITVVFEEDVDIYWARNQISERLNEVQNEIPDNYGKPQLAPVSTGLGEIYQYVVFPEKGYEDQYDITDLRTIQDWIIVPQLLGTKGVAEVNTLGGRLKEYVVAVDPNRLKSMNVTMQEIVQALEVNNENTGGAFIDNKPNVYYIRGVGRVQTLEEISKIVIKVQNEIPILVRDVAEVELGSAIRYGAATKDGKGEVVSGMVMMLKGENSAEVVNLVKEKMEQIKGNLPEGISVEPFLDRTKLVNNAIGTIEKNLLEGALIVIFILVLLIGNWRAGLIVASVIPLALLFAISLMNLFGVSGNLMSLGAIDFGLIVDGAVIIVEAIIHRLQIVQRTKDLSADEMNQEVYKAASTIRSSAAFGEIIILIVYLPILVLVGIEGKMFVPMAQTVSFAILGAFILSLTYVPMMSALFLSRKAAVKENFSDKIIAFVNRFYQKMLGSALKVKGLILVLAGLFFIGALLLFRTMGGEFIPTLEEGDLATHIMIPPGSSLEQEIESTTKAEQLLLASFPEIDQIVSKIGSAEVPTDPMPMNVADLMLIMKDKSEWTSASTKEEMMTKMDAVLADLPGVTTEFSQPIQMRFNELMTGVRSDVGIKLFGEDIDLLVSYGDQIVEIITKIDGVTDARAEAVSGLPEITIDYNKDKLALYGLSVGDLNMNIRTGFAGTKTGVVYEGEKRFDLVVRLDETKRKSIEDVKNMFISLPSGNQIPLEQVADIRLTRGPAQISREEGKRRIIVGFNVRNKDVQTVVNDIEAALTKKLDLPPGYYITYSGQFENLVEANKRLSVAVPIALLLIFALLYFTFKNVKQALLIFTAIPLSAIGGVVALWVRDMPFSISAGVGFIALFGVAVLNGIVLIGYFNQLKDEGMTDIIQRIKVGTSVRLRPVLMTAAVASLGFLPMALSSSAGAEVQKPLATVVIGGLLTATLLTLIVLPILYYYFEKGIKPGLKSVVSVILVGLSIQGWSQQPITLNLDQALTIALDSNLSLANSELKLRMQSEEKGTAFSVPKTGISATFGQYNSYLFDQSYGISQSFNPFEFSAKRRLIDQSISKEELAVKQSRQELIYQVSSAWNDLLYLMEMAEIMQKQDSLLQVFVDFANLRYQVGEANFLEKSTAENQLLAFNYELNNLQNQLRNQKQIIRRYLSLKTDFKVSSSALKSLTLQASTDSASIENNYSIQVLEQEIELAKRYKKVQQANLFPDLMVGYTVQSLQGEQVIDGQIQNFGTTPRFSYFNVGVQVPIFYKSQKATVEMAQTAIEIQENELAYYALELQAELDLKLAEYETLKAQITYYQNTALPNAALIIANASKGYEAGDIGYLEYDQALKMHLGIQEGYLKTLRNYNQTIFAIHFLINQ